MAFLSTKKMIKSLAFYDKRQGRSIRTHLYHRFLTRRIYLHFLIGEERNRMRMKMAKAGRFVTWS
jgi:hypothetical protein